MTITSTDLASVVKAVQHDAAWGLVSDDFAQGALTVCEVLAKYVAPTPVRERARKAAQARWAKREPVDKGHSYSSTQVELDPDAAGRLRALSLRIPDEALAEHGREQQPHITVKYGVLSDADAVRRAVAGFGPVRVRYGVTAHFPNNPDTNEGDPVFVKILSPDLDRLNARIVALCDCLDQGRAYVPHATLGYVQPGRGGEFDGLDDMVEIESVFHEIVFSGANDTREILSLVQSGA